MSSNFYEAANKIMLPAEEAGLAILEAIMKNRIDNEPPYKRGDVKHFRNLELGRVLRCLEQLVGDVVIPTPDELAKNYSESRLEKHRPIEVIAYAYDAAKYDYQQTKGTPAERIMQTAAFLGDKVLSAARRGAGDVNVYDRKKDTPVKEYVRILANLRNALNKKSKLNLD